MGQFWKAAALFAAVMFASSAHAQSQADINTCTDRSNPVLGYEACTRLIASGKLGSNTARAYKMRGIQASNRQNYSGAIDDFSMAIKLEPSASHYYNRGLIWMLKKEHPRAIADFEQAIRIDPKFSQAHYGRAVAFSRDGDQSRAIAGYDDAIRADPTCAVCISQKGLSYEKYGDPRRARETYQLAIATSERTSHGENEQARSIARSGLARIALFDLPVASPSAPVAPPTVTAIAPAPAAASLPMAPNPVAAAPYSPKAATAPGRRIALVIGNSDYRAVGTLANPIRDASAVANSLRSVGFQKVTLATDLTRDRLIDALKTFAAEADGADWAMVYFAGHGIEVGGLNYVLPIDAKLASDRDVQFEAIALEQIVASTEGARKLHLVMIDACRDNPFANAMKRSVASRSLGRGLAQVEPDAGTLVVFAAKHGQVAFDGDGGNGNSPFASAFIRRIATRGIEIRKLFDLVRDDVMAATNRQQQPYSYGSVPGSEDFYFLASAQ